MDTMFKCRICGATYSHDVLMQLRKTTPVYSGVLTGVQFLPCTHEFSGLEQITAYCHRCGQLGEIGGDLWDDGLREDGKPGTQYLCQDCHEQEVDADFWASPLLSLWIEPTKE